MILRLSVVQMGEDGELSIDLWSKEGEQVAQMAPLPLREWREEITPAVRFQESRGGGTIVVFH